MAAEAFAPAKVNLTLHVTGQRGDGYHLLDSLVVFVDVGDQIVASRALALSLTIDGPMAAGLGTGEDNLVLRAARMLSPQSGAAIRLTKNLPLASGIGGGSSDAAATLRALTDLWRLPLPDAASCAALGADVPVCLHPRPRRMGGIGEVLADVPALPAVWLVLVNPGIHVPTPAVFRNLANKTGAPMPAKLPSCPNAQALAAFLKTQRNDLEHPACAMAPEIAKVLTQIGATDGCLLARMSGSGATCFGLYASASAAQSAADTLRASAPKWWVKAARVLD